jgi:hypothetical protein
MALAAAAAGGPVEIVGSVSDDEAGDAAVTALGRAGVGHAALLRVPGEARPLEAPDIELGLRYLADCRVLVIAEPLTGEALRAALDGAAFHKAHVILVREQGSDVAPGVPDDATVLEQPEEDTGAFAALVGRYAAALDAERAPADAWREAISETGWERPPA